jgi:hypothetical protein
LKEVHWKTFDMKLIAKRKEAKTNPTGKETGERVDK